MSRPGIEKTYDVVIVGAGPSGSTLGYLLSSRGLDVLIIDRSEFPRPKLCGGCITWKTRRLVERLFGKSFQEHFSVESISDEYVIHEKFKEKVHQKSPAPFYFMDREKYDWQLVELAGEKGCTFLFGQKAVDLDRENNSVLIDSGCTIQGRVVVGADGANSFIRRRIFPGESVKKNLALAFQISVSSEKIKPAYRGSFPRLFVGGVRDGYGWIFPSGSQYLAGLWALSRKNKNLKDEYHHFLRNVTELDLDQRGALPAHPAFIGLFVKSPGKEKVLLTGDAAGFLDHLTGEGIYYAHKSAECASKAILDYFNKSCTAKNLIPSYKNYLIPVLKELIISRRLRHAAYSPLRYTAYFLRGNQRFYRRLAETIHGIKTYAQLPLLSRWIHPSS